MLAECEPLCGRRWLGASIPSFMEERELLYKTVERQTERGRTRERCVQVGCGQALSSLPPSDNRTINKFQVQVLAPSVTEHHEAAATSLSGPEFKF